MKKSFKPKRVMLFILVIIYFMSFELQVLACSPKEVAACDNFLLQSFPNGVMDIIINDSFIKNSPKTIIINEIDYIPLSQLQDNLGIKVYYIKGDGGYHIYWWSNFLYINKEKNIIKMNSEYKAQEHPVEIINDILYIPANMLVNIFGFKTEKIDVIKSFRIITKDKVMSSERLIKMKEEYESKSVIKKYEGPKVAYITFDDGIVRGNTEKILDILKEKDVKATFFILGNTINKNQDILKRMAEEGHSIGNHSYSHRKEIIYKNSNNLINEIERTSNLINESVGKVLHLFRPPYGSTAIRGQSYQKALENYKIVLWNVDSNDSRVKNINADQIYKNVVAQVEPKRSAIILFHETKEESIKALPMVIDYLKRSGYDIKIIDENTAISYK